jgi:hypothetical protein
MSGAKNTFHGYCSGVVNEAKVLDQSMFMRPELLCFSSDLDKDEKEYVTDPRLSKLTQIKVCMRLMFTLSKL